MTEPETFRVLSLDGGGAKGFYTLGALKEIEALVGCPLYQKFDLIYGTSTGAIIAALLGLGKTVDEIEALYRKHVVTVMARWLPSRKTELLLGDASALTPRVSLIPTATGRSVGLPSA